MNEIEEVVKEFTEADNVIRKIYPKVDPLLVVRLIFDSKEGKEHIYTLETIIKSGQNLEKIRDKIVQLTGMVPSFYLKGTKLVVSHKTRLETIKVYQ